MTPVESVLDGLRANLPVAPVSRFEIGLRRVGLVIVDEVNGFATVGGGNLAPHAPDIQVDAMIRETDRLARSFVDAGRPILVFLDSHQPGQAEPPYPPHCERGTGEDELVPALKWVERAKGVTLMPKDCINGFVGAIDVLSGRNLVVDWIVRNRLDAVIVGGICTDICVMDFVLTLLSARNHGMLGDLRDVVVHDGACATYDLSRENAFAAGLPETASHPQGITHHIGLYMMASRGAIIAGDVE